MPAKNPTPLLALLLVALVTAFVWLRPWQAETRPWEYLELAPAVEKRGDAEYPTASQMQLRSDIRMSDDEPIDVELRIEPEAALLAASRRHGPHSLKVESVVPAQGAGGAKWRDVPCSMRILAGFPGTDFDRPLGGSTEIRGLPHGRFLISFESAGDGRRFDTLVKLPTSVPVRIDWSSSGTLRGRVEGSDGRPLEQAYVEVQGKKFACDASGRFEARGLVAGSRVPVVVGARNKALYLEVVEVARTSADLRFPLEDGWTLRVTMPVAEPSVVAVTPASDIAPLFPYFALRPHALGRGRYRIEGLPLRKDVAIALVARDAFSSAGTVVRAPLTRRVVDAVVPLERTNIVSGRVKLNDIGRKSGDEAEETPRDVRVTAVAAKRPAWGRTLFGGEALMPPSWARLGAAHASVDADGKYEVAMPSRNTRVTATARGYLGQSRVLRGTRRRMTANFELDPATASEEGAAEAELSIRFVDLPAEVRMLRMRVFWRGEARGRAILVDPRRTTRIPLGGAALLNVALRRPGSSASQNRAGLRVIGTSALEFGYPDR